MKSYLATHEFAFAANVATSAIDRAAGSISGVSVITAGRATGHDFVIDQTTLAQVVQCGAAFPEGVKVKIDHVTSFDAIVGSLRNFRIDGQQARADFYVIRSHSKFAKLMEMAETMPTCFGFSIRFSGTPEEINGEKAARCQELYSVDLVDYPAANPNGLFSARPPAPSMKALAESLLGEAKVCELTQGSNDAQADLALRRVLYFSGVEVPGMRTDDVIALYGERKPAFGLSRFTRSDMQAKANRFLSTQTKGSK
jgi:hypothetical protein